MGKIKDRVYNFIVRKDENVRYEYERYVTENIKEHYENHIKHWKILWKLSWHYRFMKRNCPMLYWDKEQQIEFEVENKSDSSLLQLNDSLPKKEGVLYKEESRLINQKEPHWLAMELMQYDIISFDVFDTLLFRPFDDPRTIFIMVGEKLGILGFYNIRINAEKEARESHYIKYGNREVTIFDIYEIIKRKTGIDVSTGVQCEIEFELELCYANPYMKQLFDILKYQKKRMIVISDMYLPSNKICQILSKNGFEGFEEIYVSCDYQMSKSEGNLFQYIKNEIVKKGEAIIHIGDNENGDIKQALKAGFSTEHYTNVNHYGKNRRPNKMSRLIGSAYCGIVNEKLYCGLGKYSYAYEYGFMVGGIYIYGYMNWIYSKSLKEQIDKIIFVSRDGYIYKRIFDKYFKKNADIQTEYLYWSRISSEFVLVRDGRESFINRFINEKVNGYICVTIQDLFDSLGLESLTKYLSSYRLKRNMPVCNENRKIIADMFIDHWDDIVGIMEKKSDQIIQYVKRTIGNSKRVAIVDVGWTGQNVLKLKKLIFNQFGESVYVKCFLAGFTSLVNIYHEGNNVEAYLFSYQHNHDLFEMHHRSKKPTNNLFEMLTQAICPSFYGIENGTFIFDIPEVENYRYIKDMHLGIEDFIGIWNKFFSSYSYMNGISGYDAYLPFGKQIQDINWFKANFPDFSVSMKTLSNVNVHKIETIKDIL